MPANFDFFRKTRAVDEVGIHFQTLEDWGLPFYKIKGVLLGSKSELETLIRTKGVKVPGKPRKQKEAA